MIKKLIVAFALLFASVLFAFVGMWIAPYAVGVLKNTFTYNIILGVITIVLSFVTIILLYKKRWRIYSLLLIPHIVALPLIMLYVGNCLAYIHDGFISVDNPLSHRQIRTTTGKVVFKNASRIAEHNIAGTIVFSFGGISYDSAIEIYDSEGMLILTKPNDDDILGFTTGGFYSQKAIKEGESTTYRVRFYDLSGRYSMTRTYKKNPCFTLLTEANSKEYIEEYTENVEDQSGGMKRFSEPDRGGFNNPNRHVSTPRVVSPSGHWVYAECPTCHGYGKHVMIDCYRCNGYGWLEPGFGIRGNGTLNERTICDVCQGYKQRTCPASNVEMKKYVYD